MLLQLTRWTICRSIRAGSETLLSELRYRRRAYMSLRSRSLSDCERGFTTFAPPLLKPLGPLWVIRSRRFRGAHAEPGSAPVTDIVGSVLTRFIVLSALASIRVRASALRRCEGHHHPPLSDGDRRSFRNSRAMTRIFAERSKERRVREALLREADNLAAVCHLSRRTRVGFDRLGLRFWCHSRMLLLARVIGWINVSYREWPWTLDLNDGRSARPTVVVHFGRCFAESARR